LAATKAALGTSSTSSPSAFALTWVLKKTDPCGATAWTIDASDIAFLDRIATEREYDRNCGSGRFGSQNRISTSRRGYHSHFAAATASRHSKLERRLRETGD
jgi:hypothetical protein